VRSISLVNRVLPDSSERIYSPLARSEASNETENSPAEILPSAITLTVLPVISETEIRILDSLGMV
jgi:hypothetical protein